MKFVYEHAPIELQVTQIYMVCSLKHAMHYYARMLVEGLGSEASIMQHQRIIVMVPACLAATHATIVVPHYSSVPDLYIIPPGHSSQMYACIIDY